MKHRDGIVASVALALSVVVMAGLVASDGYARAAQVESTGYQALFRLLADQGLAIPLPPDEQPNKSLAGARGAPL
jgi:hypothetical protein